MGLQVQSVAMGIVGSWGVVNWSFVPFVPERGKVESRRVGVATVAAEALPTLLAFTVQGAERVAGAGAGTGTGTGGPRAPPWFMIAQQDLVDVLGVLCDNPHLQVPVRDSAVVVSVRHVHASGLALVFSVHTCDASPCVVGDFVVEPGHLQDVFSDWVAPMGVNMKAWKAAVLGIVRGGALPVSVPALSL